MIWIIILRIASCLEIFMNQFWEADRKNIFRQAFILDWVWPPVVSNGIYGRKLKSHTSCVNQFWLDAQCTLFGNVVDQIHSHQFTLKEELDQESASFSAADQCVNSILKIGGIRRVRKKLHVLYCRPPIDRRFASMWWHWQWRFHDSTNTKESAYLS